MIKIISCFTVFLCIVSCQAAQGDSDKGGQELQEIVARVRPHLLKGEPDGLSASFDLELWGNDRVPRLIVDFYQGLPDEKKPICDEKILWVLRSGKLDTLELSFLVSILCRCVNLQDLQSTFALNCRSDFIPFFFQPECCLWQESCWNGVGAMMHIFGLDGCHENLYNQYAKHPGVEKNAHIAMDDVIYEAQRLVEKIMVQPKRGERFLKEVVLFRKRFLSWLF